MTRRPPISRRRLLRAGAACAPLLGTGSPARGAQLASATPRLNVLLVLVEDLRTELGCFGSTRVRTPRIDALAATGLTFLRCYCQQAASGPSRASLLTGLRPDTTRVYDDQTHFRRAAPRAPSIPQHFRSFDYETAAFGRIFGPPQLEDLPSWSTPPWRPDGPAWRSAASRRQATEHWERLRRNAWQAGRATSDDQETTESSASQPPAAWSTTPGDGSDLPDARTARTAADGIRQLSGERFFVAVGFERPSFPLVAPQRLFDLYPRPTWGPPQAPEPPRDAPLFALHRSEEIRGYADIPDEGPIPDSKARELIRAYRASVTFVDSQIGLLLDALEEAGRSEDTVVAVVGVNGSHLGELGLWNKNSNYEVATHAPLVVRAPGQRNAGRRTEALVESVDLFPSLCSLCGVPRPGRLEGSSWRGLFDDPKRLWKRAAFSQHPRAIPRVGPGMGYSMRTARHRYTEWSATDSPYSTAELYDYKDSVNELRNIANRPEHGSLVNGLAHMLREGWRGSLPPLFLPTSSRG